MGINLDNYEQYFLDHTEGTLTPQQERELEAFLRAHPDLRPVLEGLEGAPVLSKDQVAYHPKKNLKKNIHHTEHIDERNAEEWMISSLEGLLSAGQQNELGEFLRLNPAFDREMGLYRKTVITADERVLFPAKNILRKKTLLMPITRATWISAAFAAMLVLFFGIRYLIQPEEVPVSSTPGQLATVPPGDAVQKDLTTDSKDEPDLSVHSGPATGPPMAIRPSTERIIAEGAGQLHARVGSFRITAGGPGEVQTTDIYQMAFNPGLKSSALLKDVDKKKPSVISRVAGGILADAGQAFRENAPLKDVRKSRMNFWSVVSSGIKGYNTITDRDIELLVQKDDEGKITSYALLEQDRLIMIRDRDKN